MTSSVDCINSGEGGGPDYETFRITLTGNSFDIVTFSEYSFTFLMIVLLFILSVWVNRRIPSERIKTDQQDDKLFKINDMRLMKPALVFLSYLIYLLGVFIIYSLSKAYAIASTLTGILYTFWIASLIGAFAVLIITGTKVIMEGMISKEIWKTVALENEGR